MARDFRLSFDPFALVRSRATPSQGATVQACARALKRAGVARVHVLALARVVKASDMLI